MPRRSAPRARHHNNASGAIPTRGAPPPNGACWPASRKYRADA